MNKVWVVNFAGHDYRKAQEHGEVIPVTVGYVSLGSLDRVIFDVASKLKDSSADDWLLPCGLIALNAIAAGIWMRLHGNLRLLLWDRKDDAYRTLTTDAGHLDFIIESLRNEDDKRPQNEVCAESSEDTS